ncbi:MAG: DNA-binding response regulator [Actinomycetales bacterium]|nr:MAG: DNA-binding response regulator [Actinomycetales bacterium]
MEGESRVLVVDDEPFLADLVATALKYAGFRTQVAADGRAAIHHATHDAPDLIVLDVGLPDIDGFEVCERIRARGIPAPVVYLTARDATEDKIAGLSAGGDDYLTKPFHIDELIARMRAILRRVQPTQDVVRIGDLEIDHQAYTVRRSGRLINLTPTEFNLLHLLARNAGRVLTKEQIHAHVWGFEAQGGDANVQTYISYLRRKIDGGRGCPLIHTISRVGYVLREGDAEKPRPADSAGPAVMPDQ